MALLARTLALLAMAVVTVAIKVVPLDMAQDSFDDQYRGCGPAMTKAFPALYKFEFQKNPLFAKTWVKAEAEWRKLGSHVFPLASPAQAVAVMAYSTKDIYKGFNKAVRAAGLSRQEYQNNFHFKTLHFLLTQALVTLRQAQNGQCRHVFRACVTFISRLGVARGSGLVSSHRRRQRKEIALRFGTDTIFQVQTCHGVDIRQFSMYPTEEEVLIPPFETFHVTQVIWDGKRTQIWLRPHGTFSKYNCAWL